MRISRPFLCAVVLLAPMLPGISQPFVADLAPPATTGALYDRAMRAADDGDRGAARAIFDSLLARDVPASLRLPALMRRAACAQALRDLASADVDYARVQTEFPRTPEHVEALLARGRIAYGTRAFQDARGLFMQCVREAAAADRVGSPRLRAAAAEAWFWIAECYAQYDQRDEARWAFDSAAATFPDSAHLDAALFERALLADRDGDAADAAVLYARLVARVPQSRLALIALLHRAADLVQLRDATAPKAVDDAARLAPRAASEGMLVPADCEATLAMLRGDLDAAAGRYVAAGVELASALGLPHGATLHRRILFALGRSARLAGSNHEAVAWFDSVTALGGERDDLFDRAEYLAAEATLAAGDTDAAMGRLQRIADNGGQRFGGEALVLRAAIRGAQGGWSDARRDAERAIRRARGTTVHARAELLRGEEALNRGAWDEAATADRAALAVLQRRDLSSAGDSVRALALLARARLGYALVRGGHWSEAVPALVEFLGTAADHPDVPEALFWLGEAYYQLDALQNARECYARYLEQGARPHREDALYGEGWCDFRMRRFDKAQQVFARLVHDYPRGPRAADAMLRAADGLYLGREYARAATAYAAAARRAGAGDRAEYAEYQEAQCYMKTGNRARAVETLHAFVAAHPGSRLAGEAQYLEGWNLFEEKNYAGAVTVLRALRAATHDTAVAARALYTIADAQYNAGHYEEALASYDQLVTAYPNSAYVDAALASEQYCLQLLGRDSLAATIVPHFAATHPEAAGAHDLVFKQGDIFYNSQRYADAVREFSAVAQRFGGSDEGARATYWLGKSYLNLGDTARALEALRTVPARWPHAPAAPQALYDLAQTQAAHADTAGALATFATLQSTYPGTQDAANGAVESATMLLTNAAPDSARAVAVLRTAAAGPGALEATARARILLARVRDAQGAADDAMQLYADVAQRSDGLGAEAQYRLGESNRAHGNYDDAIVALLRVKAVFGTYEPWLTDALLALGACYEATGRPEMAREAYQTVLAFHTDDAPARDARTRMKNLRP